MKSLKYYLADRTSNSRFAWRARLWRIIARQDGPVEGVARESWNLRKIHSDCKYFEGLDTTEKKRAWVNFYGLSHRELLELRAKYLNRVKQAMLSETPQAGEARQDAYARMRKQKDYWDLGKAALKLIASHHSGVRIGHGD